MRIIVGWSQTIDEKSDLIQPLIVKHFKHKRRSHKSHLAADIPTSVILDPFQLLWHLHECARINIWANVKCVACYVASFSKRFNFGRPAGCWTSLISMRWMCESAARCVCLPDCRTRAAASNSNMRLFGGKSSGTGAERLTPHCDCWKTSFLSGIKADRLAGSEA